MKYYLISLNGYGELLKKRFNGRTLFSFAKKPNFDCLVNSGRWGYVYLGRTFEKAYYTLFDSEDNFPGEAFIRGWRDIHSKGKMFFLGRFMAQVEGIVIEEDVNLLEKEMVELLNILSDDGKKFSFIVEDKTPFLIFKNDLPYEEVLFPDNMKGRNFNLYLYKRKELESVKNLILSSIPLLENHIVNKVRNDLGEMKANLLWVWGMGKQREPLNISEKIKKDIFYFSFEGKVLSIPEFVGFKKIDSINEVPDNSVIWINSYIEKRDNCAVCLRKFEKIDSEIFIDVLEEYKADQCRILLIFDGFISPDIEIENCWAPFLYVSEEYGRIRFKKRFKNSKFLLKLFLE